MTTLLASIIGFFSSIIPELLRFFKDWLDKSHELNILDRQTKFSRKYKDLSLQEITNNYEFPEQKILYKTYNVGIGWVDALNGTVRPVLAYSFFILYGYIKWVQYKSISKAAPLIQYIEVLWSADDQAIFAGIISFYFGQRTFSKMWRYK